MYSFLSQRSVEMTQDPDDILTAALGEILGPRTTMSGKGPSKKQDETISYKPVQCPYPTTPVPSTPLAAPLLPSGHRYIHVQLFEPTVEMTQDPDDILTAALGEILGPRTTMSGKGPSKKQDETISYKPVQCPYPTTPVPSTPLAAPLLPSGHRYIHVQLFEPTVEMTQDPDDILTAALGEILGPRTTMSGKGPSKKQDETISYKPVQCPYPTTPVPSTPLAAPLLPSGHRYIHVQLFEPTVEMTQDPDDILTAALGEILGPRTTMSGKGPSKKQDETISYKPVQCPYPTTPVPSTPLAAPLLPSGHRYIHVQLFEPTSGAAVGCPGAAVGCWVGDGRTFATCATSLWIWLGDAGGHCSGDVPSKEWTQLPKKKGALCPEGSLSKRHGEHRSGRTSLWSRGIL
ncbi:uncharacterized protein LOC123392529 [Mustela putorius furo]|uniref:Uncharacterized protein LOC123392529 n=1 Tax=Mustela putorius furo TaxID=9669 RepID=A0A8U0S791_MUSPF|nr:uncharacterized protein LOC123392529 [Mustela putorius furo]